MNKFKKFLCLSLTSLLAFTTVACGNKKDDGTTGGGGTTPPSGKTGKVYWKRSEYG